MDREVERRPAGIQRATGVPIALLGLLILSSYMSIRSGIHFPPPRDLPARIYCELLADIFVEELKTADNIQNEMLLVLLKRLIIVVTKLARSEYVPKKDLPDDKFHVVRKFNLLVEGDFRKEHSVSYYAQRLNKSPKTLSNLFAIYNNKTPLQIIQERIIIEAKRLLQYTDQSIKQITFDLGFEDTAYFSNFFKRHTSLSPLEFRNKKPALAAGNN